MRLIVALLVALAPLTAFALSDEAALQLFNRARAGNAAALAELQKAAESGDAAAQFQLGRAFSHGTGLPRDDAAAARWVEKAAEQGHTEAQSNIGYLYSAGMGVPRDNAKAIAWWTRAAEGGFGQAQFNLALSYLQGKIVEKDEAKAFFWMGKAAAQGAAAAQVNLGMMYGRGLGTAADAQRAREWYGKAVEQGNEAAALNLAGMHASGEGGPKDAGEALRLLRGQVANGNPRALALRAKICADDAAACAREPVPEHFVFEMAEAKLRIVIPDAPPMTMGPHPLAGAQANARFMGSGPNGFSISVLTPTADAGMTPQQCANSLANGLVRRYGLKPGDMVTRRNNDLTFIALFPVRADPLLQLKAYLLSGYGGTHCLEVHLSKTVTQKSEIEPWFRGFENVRIERLP